MTHPQTDVFHVPMVIDGRDVSSDSTIEVIAPNHGRGVATIPRGNS